MERKSIGRSQEDYLEAILIQIKQAGACRVTDVARQMGFTKASTSVALKKLEEAGYVYRDDWRVLLTEIGIALAEATYERHKFFYEWFKRLGVEDEAAEKDACQIEHVLSVTTYEKLREYVEMRTPAVGT